MGSHNAKIISTKEEINTKLKLIISKRNSLLQKMKMHKDMAQKLVISDKSAALMHLRLRKNMEKKCNTLIMMQENLLNMQEAIEMGNLMGELIDSLQRSMSLLKTIVKTQDIDKVNLMMDEIQDLSQHSDEIINSISPLEDFEDCQEEYEKLLEIETLTKLPDVPKHEYVDKKEENMTLEKIFA